MILKIHFPTYLPIITSNIELELNEDKPFMIISGPNGCGKSTLLQLFVGLLEGNYKPTITYNEKCFYPSENRGLVRYLPQVPENGLFSRLSVEDNIRLLNDLLRLNSPDFAADLQLPKSAPAWCLSVGQQKLLLLKAIMCSLHIQKNDYSGEPIVLLLDEPFAGLDPTKKQYACKLIMDTSINVGKRCFFIIVDHTNIKPICLPLPCAYRKNIRDGVDFEFTIATSFELIT